MRWPFDVPDSLDYGKVCETPKHLFEALHRHSVHDMVLFFEWACKDHTWIQQGGKVTIALLMSYFNQHYAQGKMELPLARRISSAVHEHSAFLKEVIQEDIEFLLDEKSVRVSSLLVGIESSEFALIIAKREGALIALQGLSSEHFLLTKEFCYTGEIVNLWRKEPTEIIELIHFAKHWKMTALAYFAADVFKRYIDKDNFLNYFLMSEERGLDTLSAICCLKFGDLAGGADIHLEANGRLCVDLYVFSDFGRVILNQLASRIIHLRCHAPACEDIQLLDLFHHLDFLDHFDLSETGSINQQLSLYFPSVRILNLSNTGWLCDESFLKILKCSPHLVELDISGSSELTFRSIGAIGLLSDLKKISLNFCKQIQDEYVDLLGASCHHVVDLQIEGCDQITDKGLSTIARQCKQMRTLNVSRCDRITNWGVIDFAGQARRIESLKLCGIRGLTADAMKQLALISDSLLEIDVRGCGIEAQELEGIVKRNTRLHFLT